MQETLVEKIKSLPPDKIVDVEHFVESLLSEDKHKNRSDSIAAYVAEHAGSDADLDEELEQTSVEFLLEETEK